ncbi:MAG: HTH-like domain-containing protein [Ginsengibacter sp.]
MPKTLNQLGKLLQDMYSNAPKKEQVTMIHLFGIKYSDDIQAVGIREVIEQSGIHSTYRTELNKAVKLAKYVQAKDNS